MLGGLCLAARPYVCYRTDAFRKVCDDDRLPAAATFTQAIKTNQIMQTPDKVLKFAKNRPAPPKKVENVPLALVDIS